MNDERRMPAPQAFVVRPSDSAASANLSAVLAIDTDALARYDRFHTDDALYSPGGTMNRVRLGVIGCGNMSRHHGRIFTQSVPEAEIVALVEPDTNSLARCIAEIFPGQPAPAT